MRPLEVALVRPIASEHPELLEVRGVEAVDPPLALVPVSCVDPPVPTEPPDVFVLEVDPALPPVPVAPPVPLCPPLPVAPPEALPPAPVLLPPEPLVPPVPVSDVAGNANWRKFHIAGLHTLPSCPPPGTDSQ
jgi:hypothetical protein